MILNGRNDMNRKKTNKMHVYFRYLIITLILSVVLFSGIIFLSINNTMSSPGEQVVLSNKLYALRGKPTQLQKDLFKELSQQIDKENVDDLVLVELVVKNFISDYYTWANKQGPYDIGGGEFIFGNENLNFKQTSRRYFYSNMEPYIRSGLSISDLFEVESIGSAEADFAQGYDYYGQVYTTFYVETSWTYKENLKIDTSVFPTNAAFIIVKTENGRYEIVRFYELQN